MYVPISVRHRAVNIFTSDYAQCNRETLTSWIKNESPFDWTNVCKWIESIESSRETPEMMQGLARSRMRAVLNVSHWRKLGKNNNSNIKKYKNIQYPFLGQCV